MPVPHVDKALRLSQRWHLSSSGHTTSTDALAIPLSQLIFHSENWMASRLPIKHTPYFHFHKPVNVTYVKPSSPTMPSTAGKVISQLLRLSSVPSSKHLLTLTSFKVASWIRQNRIKAVFAGIGATGIGTVAAPAVMVGPVLGWVGFGSGGVVGGSIAASMQAGMGNVVGGSLFALAQSAGAGGAAGLAAVQAVGGVVGMIGAVGVAVGLVAGRGKDGRSRKGWWVRRKSRKVRRREKRGRRAMGIGKVAWRHTRKSVIRKAEVMD